MGNSFDTEMLNYQHRSDVKCIVYAYRYWMSSGVNTCVVKTVKECINFTFYDYKKTINYFFILKIWSVF